MLRCVICKQNFNDGEQAKVHPCAPGQSHMLQELIDGARGYTFANGTVSEEPTNERVDFIPADERDLKKWGDLAKKLGYEID